MIICSDKNTDYPTKSDYVTKEKLKVWVSVISRYDSLELLKSRMRLICFLFISQKSNPVCEAFPAHFAPSVSVLRLKRTHTSGNSGSFEDEHQARGRNHRIPTTTSSSNSFLIQNQIIQNVQFKQESEGMSLH